MDFLRLSSECEIGQVDITDWMVFLKSDLISREVFNTWTQILKATFHQHEIAEKALSVLHFISSFEGTSCKKLQDTANSSFISCYFTSAFTSTDYKFLELQSTLSEKIFSSQIFLL